MNNLLKKSTPHIVGYVDILGIKQKIKDDVNDSLLNKVYRAIKYAKDLNKYDHGSNFIKDFIGYIKIKIFSDNILFAIPILDNYKREDKFDYEITDFDALMAMTKIISLFQSYMITECELLSRGAIIYDELFIDENFVWGKGLVRVYSLESNIAIFPRVIIDPKLMRYYTYHSKESELRFMKGYSIDRDFDGLYYVDITSSCMFEDSEKLNNKIHEICENEYNKSLKKDKYDEKILQKINWMKNTYLSH